MSANKTPESPRVTLRAVLAMTIAAVVWPAVSQAGERTERAVPRQVALSAAAPTSLDSLINQQAEEQAFNVVRRHASSLRTCYDALPGSATASGGKLEIGFTVGSGGRATDISVKAPSHATSLTACVTAAVGRWSFPAGARARVSFPLLFVGE
jgi:hypothetical protein